MKHGPNVRKLIARRAAAIAIPLGTGSNSIAAGIEFLSDKNKIIAACQQAAAEIEQYISAVKEAPDNEWDDDTEAIAGEILKQVEQRNAEQFYPVGGPRQAVPSKQDWRIGAKVKAKAQAGYQFDARGIVRNVYPSGAYGLTDKDGILEIELEDGHRVRGKADDWVTA